MRARHAPARSRPWRRAFLTPRRRRVRAPPRRCAANFIYEHLHPEYEGGWLHVDLAGPAFLKERGTGFGVGLALAMLEVDGFRPQQ